MYSDLATIALKTGETVKLGLVTGPDPEWAERMEELFAHKGEVWTWQISHMLRTELPIETRFYVVHRHGAPFSCVITCEQNGVGNFGHVFTKPEDRKKGAMSQLVKALMTDFRERGGRALCLGTGYQSVPYRIYEGVGFRGIEEESGAMAWHAGSAAEFEAGYFTSAPLELEDADWRHQPNLNSLFLGDFPGVVRCAPLDLVGRGTSKGEFLQVLRTQEQEREKGLPARAKVLRNTETQAVMGLATWRGWKQKLLGGTVCLVDVYCHPLAWNRGDELLAALALPEADTYIACSDPGCEAKSAVLRRAGYSMAATFEKRLPANSARSAFVDLIVFEKRDR
ncbi:MAG: hypothetical protein JXR37_24810 [Kiritimatiellae bacterium]|nr:hypothetical protein [Kiritimatiellia bacterium]